MADQSNQPERENLSLEERRMKLLEDSFAQLQIMNMTMCSMLNRMDGSLRQLVDLQQQNEPQSRQETQQQSGFPPQPQTNPFTSHVA